MTGVELRLIDSITVCSETDNMMPATSCRGATDTWFVVCVVLASLSALAQNTTSVPQQTKSSQAASGKLEHPVTLSRSKLADHGSRYDPDALDEDWYIKIVDADKLRADQVSLPGRLTVAIIDSGLDVDHPDFQNNLWQHYGHPAEDPPATFIGWDFVKDSPTPRDTLQNSHGTHVAGLASARWLGTKYPAFASDKLDSSLKVMILKVADDEENVTEIDSAILLAGREEARVVSGSWTVNRGASLGVRQGMEAYKNVLFVVAAGNGDINEQGLDLDQNNRVFPAWLRLPNMITVGASDPDDHVAYFSNYGLKSIDVFAPGVSIMSTIRRQAGKPNYARLSGTSQATPQVAFAAALIISKMGTLDPKTVKSRIVDTSDPVGDTPEKGSGGRLNLAKAIMITKDVMELNDADRSLKVGTIKNRSIDFAEDAISCDALMSQDETRVKTYYAEDNQPMRLWIGDVPGKSILFVNDQKQVGSACSGEPITFVTDQGETVTKKVSEIRDIVWAINHE